VAHQRLMHFRCTIASCHKMLATTKTLAEHMVNVHRRELEEYEHYRALPAPAATCYPAAHARARQGSERERGETLCDKPLHLRHGRNAPLPQPWGGSWAAIADAGVPSDALRSRLERRAAGQRQSHVACLVCFMCCMSRCALALAPSTQSCSTASRRANPASHVVCWTHCADAPASVGTWCRDGWPVYFTDGPAGEGGGSARTLSPGAHLLLAGSVGLVSSLQMGIRLAVADWIRSTVTDLMRVYFARRNARVSVMAAIPAAGAP
jgi:hypothetical protein